MKAEGISACNALVRLATHNKTLKSSSVTDGTLFAFKKVMPGFNQVSQAVWFPENFLLKCLKGPLIAGFLQ